MRLVWAANNRAVKTNAVGWKPAKYPVEVQRIADSGENDVIPFHKEEWFKLLIESKNAILK